MSVSCPHCQNVLDPEATAPGSPCPVCGSGLTPPHSTIDWRPLEGQRYGRFELIAAVGRGGFGTVYKARDPELDRLVAVKVPRPDRLADPNDRSRFAREARSAAQLSHPGIVPVLEVGQAGDVPFVVSEFVPGVTLSDWLSARRPTPEEAAALAADVADALQYAHSQGVVHRDVKPANILIETRPDGGPRPRVTDFGLARREAEEVTLTRPGHVMGTPAYMAPEQARGDARGVDGRADVYSLGVILYEMLTGGLPFRGTEPMLLHQVLHDDPHSPRSLNDRVPRDLETICLKCLEKDPARRYPTAGELADDLRRFLGHQPIRARRIGWVGRARRWARRNPAEAAATALAATAVLGLAVAGVAFGAREYAAAQVLRREQDKTRAALQESERHRLRTEAVSARLALDRGQTLCEAGDVGTGLVWLARCLELAPAEAPELRLAARRNLAAWHRRLHALRLVIPHPAAVTAAAVRPDGRALLTGCADGGARFWDAATGEPAGPVLRHTGPVRAVALSPDGRLAVTGGADGTAKVWDAAAGRQLGPDLAHPGGVVAVAFGPDDRLATGGADGLVRVWQWDAAAGRFVGPVHSLEHKFPVRGVAFGPGGGVAVVGGADRPRDPAGGKPPKFLGEIRVWDRDGRPVWEKPRQRAVNAVAFTPDGGTVLTGDDNWNIYLWDATRPHATPVHIDNPAPIRAVAVRPGGDLLATGEDNPYAARLWARDTRAVYGPLLPHGGAVTAVAFAPDGRSLLTGCADGAARVWAVADQPGFGAELHHPGGFPDTLTFSPDGARLVTAPSGRGTGGEDDRDPRARLWDARTGAPAGEPFPHAPRVRPAFRPDGKVVATCDPDGTVRLRDADGRVVGPEAPWQSVPRPGGLAFSPDGRRVLVRGTSAADTVGLYDPGAGPPVAVVRHPGVAWAAFGPGGRTVLTGSPDGAVRRWDADTGAELLPPLGHTARLDQMAVSRDGRTVLLAGADGVCRLYRADTAEPVGRPLAHEGQVWWATFSPDGRLAATCGADRTARVWDAATGRPVGLPLRHHRPVYAAEFSPDGALLVTGSADKTARAWDVATGQPVGPVLPHPSDVSVVAFRPDGAGFATGSTANVVRLWAMPAAVGGEVGEVVRWVHDTTGLELADGDVVRRLDVAARPGPRRGPDGPGRPEGR